MRLVGIKGIHWTQAFPLDSDVTIGREAGNTVVCDGDSRVSRSHAVIRPGSPPVIEDLGSSNGTFVNGVRISAPAQLRSGDEICIGGQAYRFEADSPVSAAYPPSQPVPPRTSRPREVSRREHASLGFTKGSERIYESDRLGPSGCAVPEIPDLSGCLRVLMLLLIAIVVVSVIAGLLMLVGMGIGALGGLGGGAGTAPVSGPASPPPSGPAKGAPPPPQTSREGGEIRIKEVKIQSIWQTDKNGPALRALVTWENRTGETVSKVWAKVTALDSRGQVLGSADKVLIYSGDPIEPGATHTDDGARREGFDPPGSTRPATVKVEPLEYQ